MAESPDRLIWRLQQRLQLVWQDGRASAPTLHDVAKLQSRVRRLQAFGHRFGHVRLSRHVTLREAIPVLSDRVGGECVATEV